MNDLYLLPPTLSWDRASKGNPFTAVSFRTSGVWSAEMSNSAAGSNNLDKKPTLSSCFDWLRIAFTRPSVETTCDVH